ncbi:MAG: HAMP domain-containing histidine kinase, partial [Bacteroidales bacterium]|nr:HAMP domain-containing histidine kinase [Bacteroidales bacterium]
MVIVYIILALMVGFAAGYIFTLRRNAAKINFLMDAVEDGEMNFRFNDRNPLYRALNRLRKIFEKIKQDNEVESWSKLIRVLTHEIMNTVTPIAVLSESLAEDDTLDTKAGLETIASSSKNLINFVNSYRNLSKIERPKKKTIMVKDLANKVLELNSK